MKDCQFGVSPVNYLDSDSECQSESTGIQYCEKGNGKNIHDLNNLTSNFHAFKFG